ncbi:acyl-CoA thioesterase [Robiginitalea sp. IMCC44478]|uniref:acyl-CoA thioesterase n=1 Tax=Robiginitalea sp. IMCC44478 TaxID=3459122 RepID=UPI004041348E
MKRFQKTIEVQAEDLDALEHVNNIRYLKWVQEISEAHWELLSAGAWRDTFFWVVRSHHIEYFRPVLKGEKLQITTYVEEARGALSKRIVEFCLSENSEKVARCETLWCLLNRKSMKPARMPNKMEQLFCS